VTAPTASANNPRQGDRHADDDELDAYIQKMIQNAPPLTSEQRDKLALLLRTPRRAR
jgi:hypothetical protein